MLLDSLTAEFQAKQSSPGTKSSEILEPLSHREMEVLQLLQSSLSSTEMAHELSISINTLRTHQKNIYAKLNAHSRYEAIARAKEAGLL
jgi:LuxR family maltose regulon positive regulatory protein